jgi:ABC-type dipeptide/oligopeptide/nickel transport system permease component
MLGFILNRLLQALVVLLMMTVAIFFLARLGVNPLDKMLSIEATEKDRIDLAAHLGLDRPIYEQYWKWLKSLARGELGVSVLSPYKVTDLLKTFAPKTLKLASLAILFGLLTGLPLGVLAALRRGRAEDVIARTIAVLGQSAPLFWLGLMLMYFFAIKWPIFPIVGSQNISSYILPTVSLGMFLTAGMTRLTRSSMIEALSSDYVLLARIKGLSETVVIFKHALKNALIPLVTFTGMYFALMMSGVVVTEVIFAWPGIGLLTFRAALSGDYPVLQGTVIMITAAVILINLIVDITYSILDPRIRYSKN